ncbi:uncharacterized protein LOC136084025 isoform X2 [Hydra vulgaris]|uniref:ubiquitinyl hydrolase 1 n=1 Tax=Hydra vulgaris TaxID=6087 RepID=A0ABM4CEM5_HYDVU
MIDQMDQINMVIHHVFLTRQLPQTSECSSLSGTLVRFTFDHLPTINAPMMGLKHVRYTMEKWKNTQSVIVDDKQISEALNALQPGETFAIFARAHNSVITIKRYEDDLNDALMSVFRVSSNNEKVMSEGDLFQTFPERAVRVPFNRFLFKAFSVQVAILCNETFEKKIQIKRKDRDNFDTLNVVEPIFVISWLLGAMSGTMQGVKNCICVHKVIRDDVFYAGELETPWRRSGEWFAIKCVLQLMLETELGSVEGNVVYKSMMIYIMISFLDNLPYTFDDNDIIMQILSKVSRRMAKLNNRIWGENSYSVIDDKVLSKKTSQWIEVVFKKAHNVLQRKRKEADKRWSEHINICSKLLPNSNIYQARDHISHKLNEEAIFRIKQAFQKTKELSLHVSIPKCKNRWNDFTTLFDINLLVSVAQNNQCEEILWDFEMWVKNSLWKNCKLNYLQFFEYSVQIFDLICKYFEISLKFYENDPVGSSRMILTIFLIIAVLDSTAIMEWPLLSEYHSSFDENYFDSLLIPHYEDIKYLQAVRIYFITRNMQSKYPCILSNYNVNSIGFRIANENQEMQLKKKEILLYAHQQREQKKKEFEVEKSRYDRLTQEYDRATHDKNEKGKCMKQCSKCNINTKINSIRVLVYEDPIPEDCILKQNAIVFELSIPLRIRCLRDTLFIVHKELSKNQFNGINIKYLWKSHPQLNKWVSSECQKSIVSIGSLTNAICPYANSSLENNYVQNFLRPCGLTINLFMQYRKKKIQYQIKRNQLKQKFFTMKAWNNPYELNATWITGTTHTENEVLSCQINCPLNLRLDEFKVFGSLRAGHRLQLRKILRALEMRSLSFESSSVFALIAQALWQAGPAIKENVDDPVLFFESHADLRNDEFCSVLIECLSKYLENISKNWKKHSQLQVVIILALRIFSLSSEKVRIKATILLMRCRCIAQTWATQIETLLSSMIRSSLSEIYEVRLKLIDVAAFAALTFDVDDYHDFVISKETLISWLYAVARIHDNILLSSDSPDIERRNLLRRVRFAGLRMVTIAVKILALHGNKIFSEFLSFKWPDFSKGICKDDWMPYDPPAQAWYYNKLNISENRSVTLQINILSGKFLVEGNPIGRLPEIITTSPDYKRVFGDHIFEVRPAAEKSKAFVTAHQLRGSFYTFSHENFGLVVVERRSSGDEYELIPFTFFKEHFPYFFVNNFSHWLCKQTRTIFFRPVKFDDINFLKGESIDNFLHRFYLQNGILYDSRRKRYLVNIQSKTFKDIYSCSGVKRLELKEYVHLWLNSEEIVEHDKFKLKIELPRMDLSFGIEEKTGKLFSSEHTGMVVSNIQGGFGTLIGLKHGLLLCEDKPVVKKEYFGQHKVLIMPYAKKINFKKSKISNHQKVSIELTELFSPPYFAYNIDDRLCELRGPANQVSWVYLSLLHAMTSSSLPDPFTKLTGTESSMRLLQLERTFSCKPLEQSELHVLKYIVNLAPKRKFYNESFVQSVKWLENLQSSYAYDGLALASKMIINRANLYKEIFVAETKKKKKKKEKILTKRAYLRYRCLLNSSARLHVENEEAIGTFPKKQLAWTYINECDETMFKCKDSRLLMENFYRWNGIYFSPSNLWGFVEQKKTIEDQQVSTNFFLSISKDFNVIDSYLFLYTLAQEVHKEHFCRFEFSLLLSFLVFNGENKDLVYSLLAVAILGIDIEPPVERDYQYLNETDFDLNAIKLAINNETYSFEQYLNINREYCLDYLEREKMRNLYESLKKKALVSLENLIKSQWQYKNVDFDIHSNDIVNISNLKKKVLELFKRWNTNGKLKFFFDQVENQIYTKNAVIKINDTLISLFLNPQNAMFFPKSFELKVSMKVLPINQEAVNLFRKKSVENYNKPFGNTAQRQIQFEKVLSLFDISDNKNDALFNFMKRAMDKSCNFCSKNELFLLQENPYQNTENFFDELQMCLMTNNKKARDLWSEVSDAMKPQANDLVGNALSYGGLWRRITPVVLIPCILPLTSLSLSLLYLDNKDLLPQNIIDRIGALVVCWTAEQRAIRCLKLLQNKSSSVLSRELRNLGHENWIPSSNPEWLILELEGNFLIRPIQIDIAQSMLNANENFVQQLNMGEGKTSVIVPLLAVSLATSEQLVRVTVLRSLLNTNYEALVDKLGGLLNKRVYVVPCRRDMIINPLKFLSIHQECLKKRGLMLTTPEYRLSLDLKTLEHCRKNSDDAEQLYELRCWLRKYSRDVLDETDEILNFKYQVVYTLGEQILVDGGERRWIISQAVLRLVNKFVKDLVELFGNDYIEYYNSKTFCADSFSHIRFLSTNATMYKHLCCLIADSVLNNEIPEVSVAAKLEKSDKRFARLFITSNDVSFPQVNKRLSELFGMNSVLKEELLILRGLLCFEVLHMALQKRWRVNFGVNLMNPVSKMAVPFRAKDVAAERTEFGHPDMAIILTQISYYMSGLNDNQLDEVFKYLDKCSYKDAEYERWIEAIGLGNVPKDLHVLNGVNLDNVEQKEKLYSLLRCSMNVVNFWLNRSVYPREAKQFSYRISTSAWDLCLSKDFGNGTEKCTTGFSGTNESELLLPLTIKSNDLPQTQGTNAMVLSYLLQSENNTYYHFNSNTKTLDECILNKMVENSARVLIDVGALMLQMDNKNVSLELIKKYSTDSSVSAAVYFDKDDRLMVVDKNSYVCPFSISPYFHQPDRCVFYIDDIHTRGTDLRFPFNTLACVTLGKGLTKDRLIQACMRMRLLGNGHRVFFFAANDVHLSIKNHMESSTNTPETADVLRWAINNSCDTIRNGLIHWSSQGLRRSIKEAAESFMYNTKIIGKINRDDLKALGNWCTEDEEISLFKLYGESRLLEPASDIFMNNIKKRVEVFNNMDATKSLAEIVLSIGAEISSRSKKYLSGYKCFANNSDEEHERELEEDLEEERQVDRPGVQSPHIPKLSQEVKDLVEKGLLYHNNLEILNIDKIFKNTFQLSMLFPKGCWNPGLMVTKEFTMVIKDKKEGDNFLFEICWVIVVPPKKRSDFTRYILISSFEVNELMPIFHSTQNCVVSLHMFAPRLHRGQNIFINQNSVVLPSCRDFFLDIDLFCQLSILGGGLFFVTDEEQDAFCEFLGIQNISSGHTDSLNSSKKFKYEFQNIIKIYEKRVNFVIEVLRKRDRCVQSTTSSHVCQLLFYGTRSCIEFTEVTL